MSKRRDPHTLDLLDWEPPVVSVGYGADVAGRGPLDNRIARIVGRALRDARDERGLGRADAAREIAEHLGRSISPAMLDKWSSEGSAEHRIPLDAFIALIRVTGADDLIGFIPSMFGFAAVPERYAGLIELHLIEEHEADIAARKTALQAKWRARR